MKLLVTGGAGFIGSHFIRRILTRHLDWEVRNLDNLTYCGNLENLNDVADNPRYNFVQGDIKNPRDVRSAMTGMDAVVNFAAESHVDRSIKNPNHFVKTNVYGVLTLLRTARDLGISRFLQIGTDEVYGSIAEGCFQESSNLDPSSPYSASKAGGDLLSLSFHTTYGLPVIVTRSSNNFGPYQFPEKLIPLFITNLLCDKKVPLYADGSNVRDWLYVLDNCAAIDLVLEHGEVGEVYNVGGGFEITNLDLTKKLLSFMDKGEDFIEFVTDRPGHDKRYAMNCDKIKKLGWNPAYSFDDALKETVQWYRAHRPWWEALKAKKAQEARA